jgi:hypothetical protein
MNTPSDRFPPSNLRRSKSSKQFGDFDNPRDRSSGIAQQQARSDQAGMLENQRQGDAPDTLRAGDRKPLSPREPDVRAPSITDVATETAKSVASAVSAQASQVVSDVGDELTSTAEQQKERGAQSIRGFAQAIHTAANELDHQSPQIAHRFHDAARSIESFSDNLKDRSVRELIDGVSDLARHQPVTFIAGAIVAGFTLARFLKSSAPAEASSMSERNPPSPDVASAQAGRSAL